MCLPYCTRRLGSVAVMIPSAASITMVVLTLLFSGFDILLYVPQVLVFQLPQVDPGFCVHGCDHYCIIRKNLHVVKVFKIVYEYRSFGFSLFSLCCVCVEGAKHINGHYCPGTFFGLFWHRRNSRHVYYFLLRSTSVMYLNSSTFCHLNSLCTLIKLGSTLLLSGVDPTSVVPCECVNL